jgi:hypothetical protein
MRKRILMLAAILLAAAAATFGVAGPASAATVVNELYSCSGIHSDDYHVYGTCDGSWYNAQPQYTTGGAQNRTVIVDADENVTVDQGAVTWRSTHLRYIATNQTSDGNGKTFTVYCRHSDRTTSAHKGAIYSLGGGLTTSHTFSGSGYAPCDSPSDGIMVQVTGTYCAVGGTPCWGPYSTQIDLNSVVSGYIKEYGHQIVVY